MTTPKEIGRMMAQPLKVRIESILTRHSGEWLSVTALSERLGCSNSGVLDAMSGSYDGFAKRRTSPGEGVQFMMPKASRLTEVA